MKLSLYLIWRLLLPASLLLSCKHSASSDPEAASSAGPKIASEPCSAEKLSAIELDCRQLPADYKPVPWQGAPLARDNPPYMTIARWCDIAKCQMLNPLRPVAEVAFIGDSIIQGWTDRAKSSWANNFGKFNPLQLAIGGDKTENAIWRIQNGALEKLPKLKTLVILIGTNTLGWNFSPEESAKGIAEVVAAARKVKKDLKVIVLGVLPRDDKSQKISQNILLTNAILKGKAGPKTFEFHDFHDRFLEAGRVNPALMTTDLMHPNEAGYEVLGRAIAPLL